MNTDTLFLEQSVGKLENCTKHCRNTVDNNVQMGRLGGCSNDNGILKSCTQITSNEYKEQYLIYKLCVC